MAKVAIQGGVKNYLGNQKTVGKVPIKWKSGPDHPETELAYITKAEKDLLLKKDLHNSLNGKPNKGPKGLMSLNGGGFGSEDKGTNEDGSNNPGNSGNDARDAYRADYVSQSKVKGGGKKKTGTVDTNNDGKDDRTGEDTYYDAGLTQAQINNAKEFKEEQQKKSEDYNKAQTIYGYQPNKYLDYVPYLGTIRKTIGTPLTKKGKILSAKKRMEYINSLPPQQKKAMIERLGLAEDDDYDENDMFDTNIEGVSTYDPSFNQDLTSIYGEGIATLSNDPLSYQGETPLYGMDAYDIINYDGEFLRQNKRDTTNMGSGGGQTILPYPYNVQQPEEEVPEDTGPEYRFGTGQGIGADVTRGYYSKGGKAEGGIMELRARRAFGGIMDRVTGRKAYGLGSIFKSVKKAASKVLSSDIGKMAIAGAAFYYGGGGASMFKSGGLKGMAGNFMSTKNPLLFTGGKLSLGKLAGVSTALPFLMPAAKPNETSFSDRGGQLIDPLTGEPNNMAGMRENIELAKLEAGDDADKLAAIDAKYNNMLNLKYQANLPDATPYIGYGKPGYRTTAATGGRIGKAEGGLMDLGGMEKDYRAEGGFVPIGEYEKKDDVPARLSVNEFVFTADAVRGAGQGDIDKGAEIMENMMKNLEKGGTISEESQGNIGAQQMFETSERLGEVI